MLNKQKCALCHEEKEIKLSHIIPKFVGKWLIKTSATGFIRNTNNPNKREQDIHKEYLLCGDCEQLFYSKETLFAQKIFYPYQKGDNLFYYDKWLQHFITSLSWRVGYVNLPVLDDKPKLKQLAEKTVNEWRPYLLNNESEKIQNKHEIFFLNNLNLFNPYNSHNNTYAYLLRGLEDGYAFSPTNDNNLVIYSKLPGILIATYLQPTNYKEWQGIKINKRGTINSNSMNWQYPFIDFLDSRIDLAGRKMNTINDKQIDIITDAAIKNMSKFEKSKSAIAFGKDMQLKDWKDNIF